MRRTDCDLRRFRRCVALDRVAAEVVREGGARSEAGAVPVLAEVGKVSAVQNISELCGRQVGRAHTSRVEGAAAHAMSAPRAHCEGFPLDADATFRHYCLKWLI